MVSTGVSFVVPRMTLMASFCTLSSFSRLDCDGVVFKRPQVQFSSLSINRANELCIGFNNPIGCCSRLNFIEIVEKFWVSPVFNVCERVCRSKSFKLTPKTRQTDRQAGTCKYKQAQIYHDTPLSPPTPISPPPPPPKKKTQPNNKRTTKPNI